MNYYQLDADDLAADDFFMEWVCRPTPENDAFWIAFLRDFPERYYQVEEARRLVAGLQKIQQPPNTTQQVDRIWTRIDHTLTHARPLPVLRWFMDQRLGQIAASIMLVLAVGWLARPKVEQVFGDGGSLFQPADAWTETVNKANEQMDIQLADGSLVELKKGGRLRYRRNLVGEQREVYLTGEAFFAVKKNPKRSFIVHANGLVTKALGTSFQICALANSPTVTVDVRTGRVSVYPSASGREKDPESKGMVLTPNQKAVFRRDEATLSKTLVAHPVLLVPKQEKQPFSFEDASAAQVFSAIKQGYGVDVIFDEEVMQHCTLTLTLDEEDLFQKLQVICKVLDAEYKLIDAQVIIYSKGCPPAMD